MSMDISMSIDMIDKSKVAHNGSAGKGGPLVHNEETNRMAIKKAGKLKFTALSLAAAPILLVVSQPAAAQNPTILFNAAGATALYNTFALAALWGAGTAPPGPCGNYIWTQKKGGAAHDNRNPYTNPPDQLSDVIGNIWIAWDNSTNPTVVCAYVGIDSTNADRMFFANPRGQLDLPTSFTCSSPPAGSNLVPGITDTALPTNICNEIYGANGASSTCLTGTNCVFNAAPGDQRPEDALWNTTRVLAALPQPYACGPINGLGYSPGPAPGVGVTIDSAFSSNTAQPANFAISGDDPISGLPVQSWLSTDIGAISLLVLVNTSDTSNNGLGSTELKSILNWQIGEIFNGTASTTQFIVPGATLSSVTPIHVLEREPVAGNALVFEYTTVAAAPANSSQECGVTNPAGGSPYNPLDLTNATTGGTRQRTVGSSEMATELGDIEDSIGYTFFSFGNVSSLVGKAKYLEVNSVDPLYSNGGNPNGTGALPSCTTPPCTLTFPNIGNGTYPLWNVARVITASPEPSGISSLLSDAELQAKNEISDFLPIPLTILRSHFTDPGQTNTPANGLLCTGEQQVGGDVGGQYLTTTEDKNFIAETGGVGESNGSGGCKAGRSGTLGRELINLAGWYTP